VVCFLAAALPANASASFVRIKVTWTSDDGAPIAAPYIHALSDGAYYGRCTNPSNCSHGPGTHWEEADFDATNIAHTISFVDDDPTKDQEQLDSYDVQHPFGGGGDPRPISGTATITHPDGTSQPNGSVEVIQFHLVRGQTVYLTADYPAPEDPTPHGREGKCSRTRIAVAAITTSFANPATGSCWGWWRMSKQWRYPSAPSCGPGTERGCCRFSKLGDVWAYDEFAFEHAEDKQRMKQCAHHLGAHSFGVAYYAHKRGSWAFSHRPNGVGGVGLLELYNGQQIINWAAFSKWHQRYRKKFGAMVSIGGAGSDQAVYKAVLSICKAQKYVGLYAGSNQKARLTASRRTAVFNALDACTHG
jgi:hypothetical protein